MLAGNLRVNHSRNMFLCRGQEIRWSPSNTESVEPDTEVAQQVARDVDDVLDAILLFGAVDQPVDRLFDKLVDLLVESLFLSMRDELAEGLLAREQLVDVAATCQEFGLLPLRRGD